MNNTAIVSAGRTFGLDLLYGTEIVIAPHAPLLLLLL
jgi:hypothetical protein